MPHALIRRAVAPFIVAAALAGGLAAVAQPAAAAPPAPATNCSLLEASLESIGTHVVAEKFRICDNGTIIELNVNLQQKNPATGAWSTVATGLGTAGYRCQGTATRRYRIGITGNGTPFPCS